MDTKRRTPGRKATLASITIGLILCGCDREAEPAPRQERVALKGMPLTRTVGDNKLARRLAIQGTWVETSRPTAPGRQLVLEVAGTSEYTMDLRGSEGGAEVVFASGRGRLTWSADDLLHGSGEGEGALAPYRTWTAGFPKDDRMLVRIEGRDVEMARRGG